MRKAGGFSQIREPAPGRNLDLELQEVGKKKKKRLLNFSVPACILSVQRGRLTLQFCASVWGGRGVGQDV